MTAGAAATVEMGMSFAGRWTGTACQVVTRVTTERVCTKEIVLFPRLTCSERKDPAGKGQQPLDLSHPGWTWSDDHELWSGPEDNG